jgi:2-iminobutanoate/2-iminopropanoate deaminase
MSIEYIATSEAPLAFGPFSQAAKGNGFVFTSGALPLVPQTGELVDGGIREQTTQTLLNLKKVVEAAGSSLQRVVLITVYLTSMDDFAAMNEIYSQHFAVNFPARATVGIASLAKGAKVEMQAIALSD